MRTLLSRAIQIDPNFHVALELLVILAIGETFLAMPYCFERSRASRDPAMPTASRCAHPAAGSSSSASAPAWVQLIVAPPPVPPTLPPAAAVTSPAPRLVDQFLRGGKELRERGDTTTAL